MAETLGAAGSIPTIVGFGLQLATSLQTYVEICSKAEKKLCGIALEISSSASALSQLQQVLEAERRIPEAGQETPVFKDDGLRQIEMVAVQCDKVYKCIVMVILKAGAGCGKGKQATDILDVRKFTTSGLTGNLKWSWLKPRIKRCQEKLKWLKMNSLFFLQVTSLAHHQIQNTGRLPGSFDQELILRIITEQLRLATNKHTKKMALRFEKVDGALSLTDCSEIASVHTVTTNSINITTYELNSVADTVEDALDPIPGCTRQNFQSQEMLHSDRKKISSPLNGVLDPGSENKVKSTSSSEDISESVTDLQNGGTLVGDDEDASPWRAAVEDEVEQRIVVEKEVVDNQINVEDKSADEEIIIKEHICLPTGDRLQVEIVQDGVGSKPPRTQEPVVDGAGECKPITEDRKKTDIISLPLYQPKSGIFPSWLTRFFGKRDKFLQDWESQVLEAFVVHKDSPDPVKLPFGHQRLTLGLKQVMKKDDYMSWDQYLSLDLQHHRAIDRIIADAKQSDPRQRTFLGLVKEQGHRKDGERVLIFFSLGGLGEAAHLADALHRKVGFSFGRNHTWELRARILEAELVRLRAEEKSAKALEKAKIEKMEVIKFKDAVGRIFSFPFQNCKTWAGLEELIKQAFIHVDVIGPHVFEGHYDIVGPRGEIVLPQVWEALVEPDWAVAMHLWPLPEVPTKPQPPPQRRGGPPPPPPGWIGPPPRERMGPNTWPDEVVVIESKPQRKPYKRRHSRPYDSSDSDSSNSDSDNLVSDSEIDDDGLDEELLAGIDFEKEKENVGTSLGELLSRWTNATDTGNTIIPESLESDMSDSDSGSSSGSGSFLLDD